MHVLHCMWSTDCSTATFRCHNILPEGDLIYPITFTPTQVGDRRLCVQLQSDKLGLIISFQNLEVLPNNVEECKSFGALNGRL